nr:LysM peptidoglycan-binding domain-containing protein [uncultured Niameybacter sp.]
MGTIVYDPKKKKNKEVQKTQDNQAKVISVEEITPKATVGEENGQAEERYNTLIENIDSVRPMGDTDCSYVIYLEDYVYTYIYQYANTNLACEHSAVVVGEYYPDSKEMIICGIMPIAKEFLSSDEEWINEEAILSLQNEKEKYFPGASLLGWLHMQPGYGTMLTMKEVKAHRELFEKEGTLLLLVDPINKIETFYVYEDDTLKEQSGYYLYYDKNPCMQQYMLDKPFITGDKEEVNDNVVSQFREIGKIRKKEYEQRKKMNLTVIAASIALLALSAVVLKMNDQNARMNEQNAKIQTLQDQLSQAGKNTQSNIANAKDTGVKDDAEGQFVFNTEPAADVVASDVQVLDKTDETSATDSTTTEDTNSNLSQVADTSEPKQDEEGTDEEENTKTDQVDKSLQSVSNDAEKSDTVNESEEAKTTSNKDYIEYVVQEGDSLRKISYDHYQTELRTKDIIALNELENGDHIWVGQVLKLPAE